MAERVLLVDDEESGLFFLSEMLRAEGYEVMTAMRASEAISKGLAEKPDILITDWMLRDSKDGIDVARELYAANPAIRVLLITGMSAGDCAGALASLPDSVTVVEKPVDLEKVLNAIGSTRTND